MKKILGIIVILCLVVISATYFSNQNNDTIKIGAIQSLTGDVSSIGENAKDSILLAVNEINSSGGINGKKLEVIFEDGQCNSQAGNTAMNKLAYVDNVSVVIGGLCSGETMAAAPIAEENEIILLSNCSSNPAISDMGDYIFRVFPSDTLQAKYAADLLYNRFNAKNVAILSCLDDWCTGVKDVFTKDFKELGGEIVISEEFESNTLDLKTQLSKIKETNPDYIYFIAYTNAGIVGIKQINELGITTPVLGGEPFSDNDIWESVQEQGNGIRFTMPSSDFSETFKTNFFNTTGRNAGLCSPQAYDAVYLIADIMKKVGTDSEKIKNELYKIKEYEGVSGIIGFDSKGDLITTKFETRIVQNGSPIVEFSE